MKKLLFVPIAVAALAPTFLPAQGQDAKAAYDRAESLTRRVDGLVYNVVQTPTFIAGTPRLWYRKSVKGGNEFVLVDAVAKTKGPAFDHARLAAALSTAASGTYTAVTLPFATFVFVKDMQAIEFSIGAGGGAGGGGRRGGGPQGGGRPAPQWQCSLTDYTCTRGAAGGWPAAPGTQGCGQGRGAVRQGRALRARRRKQVRNSPDNKWQALIQNFNIYVRPVAGSARALRRRPGDAFMLSTDGSEGNAYTINSLRWSPDSKKIAAFRRRPGYERLVHYVESSPADQVQPKHTTNFYRKPGDVVDFDHPVVFNVETKQQMPGDAALFPNPYANTRLEWRADSRAVTFEYNQRGHQVYRVVEIDAATGTHADDHRRNAEDVRRVLGQAVSARTSPTARRSSGPRSATAGITCISTTAPPGR